MLPNRSKSSVYTTAPILLGSTIHNLISPGLLAAGILCHAVHPAERVIKYARRILSSDNPKVDKLLALTLAQKFEL